MIWTIYFIYRCDQWSTLVYIMQCVFLTSFLRILSPKCAGGRVFILLSKNLAFGGQRKNVLTMEISMHNSLLEKTMFLCTCVTCLQTLLKKTTTCGRIDTACKPACYVIFCELVSVDIKQLLSSVYNDLEILLQMTSFLMFPPGTFKHCIQAFHLLCAGV